MLQVRSSMQVSRDTAGPCRESCSCWESLAGGATCGERIHFVTGLPDAAAAVQLEFPDICSCASPAEAGPCKEGCGCWNSPADNHTCGARIIFLATRREERSWNRTAASKVQQEHATCSCTSEEEDALKPKNVYSKEEGIGGWGGWCTCPDGQRYEVGEKDDACKHGPASLACIGGVPGECQKYWSANRAGMSVACAAADPMP